jgi:hypothetical protein
MSIDIVSFFIFGAHIKIIILFVSFQKKGDAFFSGHRFF